MRLVCLVDDPESVAARVNVLIRNDLVAHDIDVSLDLRFLHQKREQPTATTSRSLKSTYRLAVTPQDVQMRSLDNKVPELPGTIVVALLAHPSLIIRLSNLLDNALPRLERVWSARSRTSILRCHRLLARRPGLLELRGSHLGRRLLLVLHLLTRLSSFHLSPLGIAVANRPHAVPETVQCQAIGCRRTPREFPAAIQP